MTDPLSPWPSATPRRIGRELAGVLLVLLGAAVLLWVLATVDWRLAVGTAAAATAGIGSWLALGEAEPTDEEA